MCGLLGFSERTPVTQTMTPCLAIYMAQRGKDSWGATDGDTIFKEASSILEGWVDLEISGPQLYHTRAASVGAVTDDNAHPFEFTAASGLRVVGAHNGHISNHYDLDKKYPERNFSVDSQHIFAHLAERKDLAEIGGWGTVIWWEHPPGRPAEGPFFSGWENVNLAVAKLSSGEVVWASAATPITIGARYAGVEVDTFYKIEPKHKYRLAYAPEHGGHYLTSEGVLAWAERPFVKVYPSQNASGSSWPVSGGGRRTGILHCGSSSCHTIIPSGLFCKKCIHEVQTLLGIRSHASQLVLN